MRKNQVQMICARSKYLRPWELDAIGVDDVSNEGEHGNTSMLDLCVAQEANGGLIAGTPELSLCQVL